MKLLLNEGTELLYLEGIEGSYLKEANVRIIGHENGGYILDKSIMHYQGGGQPGDRGHILFGKFRAPIYNVKKQRKNILHMSQFQTEIEESTLVLDWERRYKIMKMHTLQHAISSVIFKEGFMTINSEVFPGYGFIETDKEIMRIPDGGYKINETNLKLRRYYIDRKQLDARLLKRCNLDKLPKSLTRISIVEIDGLDICACAGTHVKNTSEIGNYWIRNFGNKLEFGSF